MVFSFYCTTLCICVNRRTQWPGHFPQILGCVGIVGQFHLTIMQITIIYFSRYLVCAKTSHLFAVLISLSWPTSTTSVNTSCVLLLIFHRLITPIHLFTQISLKFNIVLKLTTCVCKFQILCNVLHCQYDQGHQYIDNYVVYILCLFAQRR